MKTTGFCALSLLFALSTYSAGIDRKKNPAPMYNLATEIHAIVTIVDVREVSKEAALDGVHLTVMSKNDNFDVYLGPVDFVKRFDVAFKKGDEIELTGSRVRVEGEDLVLAREVRFGQVTLILRDKTGWPYWDSNKPPAANPDR